MDHLLPSFVLGFHGCDRAVADRVLQGRTTLRASKNEYDWLGHGVYFWENDPHRALDFARMLRKHRRTGHSPIRSPSVIGAVIDLGACLNLLEFRALQTVKECYDQMAEVAALARISLPSNTPLGNSRELLLRRLDCAVIEYVHQTRRDQGKEPFDTVRGVFVEGDPLYPNAGFHDRNHIQICVRSSECIKGYFRVRAS